MIDPVPQPRIDTIVDDTAGEVRRRTEYAGTVWFGGRPRMMAFGAISLGSRAQIDSPFFIPDSLPYRRSLVADAVISCTVGIQSANGDYQLIHDVRADLADDPRAADLCWLRLQVIAVAMVPLAITYRIVVLVRPEAVRPPGGPDASHEVGAAAGG